MLITTYQKLRHSIVALVPRFSTQPRKPLEFPPIVGTGFVVHEDGVIATNDHVIDAIRGLPHPPEFQGIPSCVLFLILTSDGMAELSFGIEGVYRLTSFTPGAAYYGPPLPDIGFVQINVSGLLAVTLRPVREAYVEGESIATAGFPMGTDQLKAPGWLHQLSPTLQTGIVSAVHPFPCTTPHGFTINVMAQGGASGSPVFNQNSGEVLGTVHAGIEESHFDTGQSIYQYPTNYTWVVPSHFLVNSLKSVLATSEFKQAKTLCKPITMIIQETEAINPFTGKRQEAPKLPW